jgi:putative membrane protein insertion efficiency factor
LTRRLALLFAVLTLVLLVADLSRPADRQVSVVVLRTGIHVYQHTLSPVLAATGVRCRFTPSCSRYGEAVIAKHGAIAGSWMAARRVLRCGPWTPIGTVDEPQ